MGLGDADGRVRAVIDDVRPCVDCGATPAKRVVGEPVDVEADVLADGHELLGCVVEYRHKSVAGGAWRESRLHESHNDLWLGRFIPTEVGSWEFRVRAWVDPFLTWAHDLERRIAVDQDIEIDLRIGAAILRETAREADPAGARLLREWAEHLDGDGPQSERGRAALETDLADLMWRVSPRRFAAESPVRGIWADRPLALRSAWYEMFPRSASPEPGRHGTLRDVIDRLPYVHSMGFDVLYLPPIHPIGVTARKGRNNAARALKGDAGSPWAVGGPEGGHKAIHPALGDFDDFDRLVTETKRLGMELALDIAFQCSPDHPYVKEHPEWFRHRPDGTIQYAENPPKKYQDIYPFDFECGDWRGLWAELKSVFDFWIGRGVTVFRVDNPHTKPFGFWEWVIKEIKDEHPGVIFLSEAFTRPKKMYRLAKGGFTQSYTYFAWRNGPADLREYMEQISQPPVCDLFRPSFWPNTPDILTDYLRDGGRNAGIARLVLAATLSPSYGIYGPVYELCDYRQRTGAEENLDSEKYEARTWDLDNPWSLRPLITRLNRIRREHPSLQQFRDITFHDCDNPAHIAYSKRAPIGRDTVLCVVNTNPHAEQWGTLRLDLAAIGAEHHRPFDAHDLLTGVRYGWYGPDQTIGLGPGQAHVFHIETGDRPEDDNA